MIVAVADGWLLGFWRCRSCNAYVTFGAIGTITTVGGFIIITIVISIGLIT